MTDNSLIYHIQQQNLFPIGHFCDSVSDSVTVEITVLRFANFHSQSQL